MAWIVSGVFLMCTGLAFGFADGLLDHLQLRLKYGANMLCFAGVMFTVLGWAILT